MASTQARQNARARARAAQQKVLVDRKRRDDANMTSLTAFFTAAEQIDAAQLAMAHALDDIRNREGTLSAAATLAGITTGEARKLLALLTVNTTTSASTDTDGSDAVSGAVSATGPPAESGALDTADSASSGDATIRDNTTDNGDSDTAAATGQE
ncbi:MULTISPECIES: hypothetical protein [unclassified Rhodococcus (in: high G+C Gram-positive bacteria)]|uniref:hypothetical protein n=1 Tax=unclassified Rhodococcus (in: high G+C Gram-positive bacteria) TaxID=192944 RepID=UPI003391AB09